MTSDILLGIDLGTSVLKAAAFEARTGRVLAADGVRLPICSDDAGAREQDPRAIDRAFRRLAATLQRRLGRAWSCIAGIGLAAQGGSAILVDRRTGRPLTPMQLWNDTRPLHLLPALAARKPPGYWRRLAFLPEPGAGLARIQWLRRRHPRLFTNNSLYVGAGEYIYFHLTGVWRQDAGSALQVGCYDARRRRIDGEPLHLVGVTEKFVAPMRQDHETHPLSTAGARLLGLPAGIPVAGPYMDHEAGYLSSAGVSARPLQCSLGTAWVGNFVTAKAPPPGFNLVLPSPLGRGSLVVRVMSAGNMTQNWALESLIDPDHAKALKQAEAIFDEELLPPDGLVALPWLTQPNFLAPQCVGSGGFFGISTHTTREDLVRATVAGMCFELARIFEAVLAARTCDSVILGGGASKGRQFRTILAALFQPLPAYRVLDTETAGPRGTLHAFSLKAAQAATRRLRPPAQAVVNRIRKQYELYRELCEVLARSLPGANGVIGHYRRKKP
jgi:sugar (pentulose or hexulose) kinase